MSSSSASAAVSAPTVADLQAQVLELNRLGNIEVAKNAATQAALDAVNHKLANRISKPKIPSPRTFDGKIGTGVVIWLDEIAQEFPYYLDFFDTDEKKVAYALRYSIPTVRAQFENNARDEAAKGTPIDTWVKFVTHMTAQYQPFEAAMSARSRLLETTQTASAQAYASLFLQLMTYIDDMSAADQVHQFCRGLKSAIRIEVMKSKPKTLSEAINSAVGFEVYIRQVGGSNTSSSSLSYRPHQARSSYAGGASSSTAMDLNNIELESEPSAYLDAAPSRESHLLAVIRQQQENQSRLQQQLNALSNRSQDRRSNSGNKIPDISREVYQRCRAEGVCIRCKETGHIAKDCKKPIRLNW